MRILGQDGEKIVFTENIDTICIEEYADCFKLLSFNGNDEGYTALGVFKTKEKPLEVIKRIFRSDSERFIIPKDDGEDDEA